MLKQIYTLLFKKRIHTYNKLCETHQIHNNPELIYILFDAFKKNIFFLDTNIFFKPPLTFFIVQLYQDSVRFHKRILYSLRRWKQNRLVPSNTEDMSMTSISSYQPFEIVTIMDRGQKYVFKWTDLFNLITTSLTYADDFLFSVPNPVKNPYTGLAFSKELLYVLYIRAIHTPYQVPVLFTLFMKTDFDIKEFNTHYDCILKPYIIKNKINSFSVSQLRTEIITMFKDLVIFSQFSQISTPTIYLPEKVPISKLIHFKPLLVHYYNYVYLSDLYQRHTEYIILIKKVIAFKKENPYFECDYEIITPIQKVDYKKIVIPKIVVNIESYTNNNF
jgi:hypothetical protein